MSIVTEEGRHKLVTTAQDVWESLRDEIGELTPQEYRLLEVMMEEIEQDRGQFFSGVKEAEFENTPVGIEEFLRSDYYMGDVGKNLYPILMDNIVELFEGGYSEAILTGSIGLDSIIQEADGGLPTLRERIGVVKDVLVLLEDGLDVSTTEAGHDSGVKEVLRVTLANGMRIDLTPDHEVQVYRDGVVWVAAEDLGVGDRVLRAREIRTEPSSDISSEEARLLAYWTTDGSSSEKRSRFKDGNLATSIEVVELLEKMGFSGVREQVGEACWEVYVEKNKTSGFRSWIEENDVGGTYDVVVPDRVCRASNRIVAEFLNRVWAAEGTVYANPKVSPPRFALGMVSERYIRQVQMLLLRFGIQARVADVDYVDKRSGVKRHIWHLVVSGINDLRLFLENIGDVFGKEEKCRVIREYCAAKKPNTNVDMLPITWGWLNDFMVRSGVKREVGNEWWRLGTRRDNHVSRDMLGRWLSEYGETDAGKYLGGLFPVDVAYEPVASIEPILVAIPVGDIGAHNGNRFLANGMSVHNSIGWGKSFFSSLVMVYILYLISCMKHPQKSYGIDEGSSISLCLLSVNEKTARRVVFNEIVTKLERSPYFQEQFPFKRLYSEVRFFRKPVLIVAGSTASNAILGLNVFGGIVDEANFMGSMKRVQGRGSNVHLNQLDRAEIIYETIIRRMKSRFMRSGKLPGVLMLPSSKDTVSSFTERRIKEAKDDPSVFVADFATWDVKKRGQHFSKKTFPVLVGNERVRSKILEPEEVGQYEDVPEVTIIDVPEDYRRDFERNLEDAVRDIAGMSTIGISPFINRRTAIDTMFERGMYEGLEHNFSVLEWQSDRPGDFIWDRMVKTYRERLPGGFFEENFTPLRNPDAPRHVGFDTSLTGDATGLAVGHISGWHEVVRRDSEGTEYNEVAPEITFDLVLRIIPPLGDEILLGSVRALVYQLMEHGYNISYSSGDQYQSSDTKQKMAQRGVQAEIFSVDKDDVPYSVFKTALYEERIICYRYPILITELENLEYDRAKRKVDHPNKNPDGTPGSKDVADAVARVVFSLTTKSQMMPVMPFKDREESEDWKKDDSWVLGGWKEVKKDDPNESGGGGTGGGGDLPPMPFTG